MNSYKIRVKTDAERKETQELLFELGYQWPRPTNKKILTDTCIRWLVGSRVLEKLIIQVGCGTEDATEITVAALRDKVVLHRNNVHDATHCDNQQKFIYLTSDQIIYYWDGEWLNSAINKSNDYENYITKSLTLIPNDQEITPEYKAIKVEGLEGLVDGKAALTAALAGETVQISVEPWEEKNWDIFNPLDDDVSTKVFFTGMSEGVQKVFFRIKPKTILINGVEVPAPFTPKEGDTFYYLNDGEECGYIKCEHDWAFDPKELNFGAWRTEEEIKQVVAALRKLFEVQL